MYIFSRKIKSFNYIFLTLLFGFSLMVTGCDTSHTTQNENRQSDDKTVTIATVKNGKLMTSVSKSKLRNLATKAFNKLPENKTIDESVFDSVFVQGSGKYYYIVGKGKDANNNCVSVARSLAISSHVTSGNGGTAKSFKTLTSGEVVPVEYTHSCSGDPCESCDFTRDTEGKITGCDCSNVFGYCEHTVSTG